MGVQQSVQKRAPANCQTKDTWRKLVNPTRRAALTAGGAALASASLAAAAKTLNGESPCTLEPRSSSPTTRSARPSLPARSRSAASSRCGSPEHSHIPLSRKSPFPPGGELPKMYYDVMDPFMTLTRRRGGDDQAEARHRRLPRDPARHRSRPPSWWLEPRPDLERPLPVRHRRRLEPGRDGGPRHRLREALQADARAASRPCRRSGPSRSPSTTASS